VAVEGTKILKVGSPQDLQKHFTGARIDDRFKDDVIIPGLIDPHVHMILGAMMYSKPFAPPWDVQTPKGVVKGLPDRASFLKRISEINAEHPGNQPLVIYGYHNLVQGPLDRHDLDKITTKRPLIIWHYSGHDFYLNTIGLAFAKVDASWAQRFHGVPVDENGELTGRVYEDAVFAFLNNTGAQFLSPADITRGFNGLEDMFARNGVTSVAEMGYGLFGRALEDKFYELLYGDDVRTKLYLVPEYRAFSREFGNEVIPTVFEHVNQTKADWPRVLPQIKLFTDAAFYSQTMRMRPPGYTGGQSKGTNGLWVMGPDRLTDIMGPLWRAGLDIHIHSNGDAAQDTTLAALKNVQYAEQPKDQRLILEHVGIIRPEQLELAKTLPVGLSVASHYVYYMGEMYKDAIGERVRYMTPLASSIKAGLVTTMHSDAPLAPPSPLTAASVHVLRSTREGGVSTPTEQLSRWQALRAVTWSAAWSLGLEDEIGSIEPGKQADFTILSENPLQTDAQDWPKMKILGVVLDGTPKPLDTE
ncbi:MAG TPA: amidohydrolase, partial [Hellea balneolensis]|nr:amidohydrolase [Hellea balneolensis]